MKAASSSNLLGVDAVEKEKVLLAGLVMSKSRKYLEKAQFFDIVSQFPSVNVFGH